MPHQPGVPRPELVALGNAVRRRREARDWTPEALAQESGVSRRTIGNLESGAHNTGVGTLIDVAAALGASLTDLLSEATVDPGDMT